MRHLRFTVVLWLGIPSFLAAQIQRHTFTFDDAASLRHAEAVAVSPDGKTVLYKVMFGASKGPDQTEWKLTATSGSDIRNLNIPETFKPSGFTGDGKALYGTGEINKLPQLTTLALLPPNTPAAAAAAPAPLTTLPRGIHYASISPDGKRYVILADPRLPDPLAEVHTVIEAEPTSLYVINADGSEGAWWCPSLHEVRGVAWSPDSSSLAVQSQSPKIGFHDVHSSVDVCGTSGSRHVASIDNSTSGIGWINGGKELIFLGTTSPVLTPDHVWTVPAAGGAAQDRTPTLQGSAVQLSVDAMGHAWVTVMRGVQGEIDAFRGGDLVAAFKWPDGTIDGTVIAPQIAASTTVQVLTVSDPQHSSNVAIAQGSGLQRISTEGDDQLAKIALGERRIVHWSSTEGISLEGIVTFPANYLRGQRCPFMVLPHGGPEANDTLGLGSLPRTFSGMGYIVLQPEYRGSTGYGTDFMSAIYQRFGDRAYRDVDSATDFAIAQGWADPNRLTIFGWSAGGFMTAWTVTQTHRYKAAIEGAGISDWLSFMWTSDLQQTDYDNRWTDKDPAAFLVFSPSMHSENVTTPLLILHGAADERVPTYQGRELFEILAARGKSTRMVTYPGSPHFPSVWEQRHDLIRETAAWLAKYNP